MSPSPSRNNNNSNNNTNNNISTSTTRSIIRTITRAAVPVPSKKLKIMTTPQNNDDEFEIVKEYLLKCPHVSSVRDSSAIKAAIDGIEKEQRRRVRDAKLQSKFGATTATITSDRTSTRESDSLTDGDEIVVVEKDDIDVTVTTVSASAIASVSSPGIDAPVDATNNDDDDTDMEWQDVVPHQKADFSKNIDVMASSSSSGSAIGDSFSMEQGESDSCFLGRTLAKACINAIAEQQQQHQQSSPVVVSTPLAAIALALHTALRSDVLGFACTGVPEEHKSLSSTKKGGGGLGFAPPVREMSKTDFLPHGWDDENENGNKSLLSLRYRKMDTGAVVLTVLEEEKSGDVNNNGDADTADNNNYCQVTFVPANSKDDSIPGHPSLRFPISEHINLDSWNAALKAAKARKSNKIAPSLHYKNLSGLLSKFCRTFDLGDVNNNNTADENETTGTKINAETSVFGSNTNNNTAVPVPSLNTTSRNHPITKSITGTESRKEGFDVPSTFDQAFPAATARRMNNNYPPPHGDFADDLLPASGLHDPRFGGRVGAGRIGGGGNLMGPNHPLFSSGGAGGNHGGQMIGPGGLGPGGGFAFGGPGTMQPRYDPLVPPGIGGDDDLPSTGPRNNPRASRTIKGEPNPDHLPPPNSLGNNMFM